MTVNITIDGQKIEAQAGQTILDVARSNVPSLVKSYLPNLALSSKVVPTEFSIV